MNDKIYIISNSYKKLFPYIWIFIFSAFSILLIIRHEYWEDEVVSWLFASEANNFKELIFNLKADSSHPYLWFILLYVLSHYISSNIEIMKVLHLAISIISAFLILKFFPFNKIIKVLTIFSYLLFYEYSIISRNYALGVLLIIIFCIIYKDKKKNFLFIVIILFLLGQVNIFTFIISIGLTITFLIELILDKKSLNIHIGKFLFFSIIIIGGFLFFIQIKYRFEIVSSGKNSLFFLKSLNGFKEDFYRISRGIIGAYFQMPTIQLNFFNSNFLVDVLFKKNYFLTYTLGFVLFVLPFFIIKKRFIFFYFFSFLIIILIPLYFYKCGTRHFGHYFLLFLTIIWIQNYSTNDNFVIKIKKERNYLMLIIFLNIILTVSILGSVVSFYFDYKYPFSAGKNVASYIKRNFNLDDLIIIGYQDYAALTISGYLNKDFYYPNSKDFRKIINYDKREYKVGIEDIIYEANKFADKNNTLIILNFEVNDNSLPKIFKPLENNFTNSIVHAENYYLFYFEKNDFKVLNKIDYANFYNFFRKMNQIDIVLNKKLINIISEGDDPWFESKFPITFDNQDIILKIKIISPVNGEFRVFYGVSNKEYVWEHSSGYLMKKGLNVIFAEIPKKIDIGYIDKIRIDPIDSKNNCQIISIELLSSCRVNKFSS